MPTNSNITSQQFIIKLKYAGNRGKHIVSHLTLLLSILVFLFSAVSQSDAPAIIFFSVFLLFSLWTFARVVMRKLPLKYFYIVLLAASVYWFVQGGILMGLMLGLAALLDANGNQQPIVQITTGGVAIKHLLNKQYGWADLTNVILKDGLLTIDSKSNKLLQKEPEADISEEYEREINEFCRSQLSANS